MLSRATIFHRLPAVVAGTFMIALGGCTSGDFGRVRESMRSDDMHRWEGAEVTASIGVRASDFQLTDTERKLRDQAYYYIEPPHSRPAWKNVFGDYNPIPAPWRQTASFNRADYGRLLIDEPHRSHASRYAQLIEDARNDLTQFDPFYRTAVQVYDYDAKRNAAMKLIDLSPRERADAVARMRENSLIVDWVQQCMQQRIASYRWALERLVVMAPDDRAAEADRIITELAARASHPPVANERMMSGQVVSVKG